MRLIDGKYNKDFEIPIMDIDEEQLEIPDAEWEVDIKMNSKNSIIGDGNLFGSLMIIGETPGYEEDRSGLAYQGEIGNLLKKMFFAISQPDPKLDVLKTNVDVKSLENPVEQFTIEFSQDSSAVNMSLIWDKASVSIPLE